MPLNKIGLIGGGNMGNCLIGGLIRQGHSPNQLWVADHHKETCVMLREKWGVHTTIHNIEIVKEVDIILLAIKPQDMQQVISEIAPFVDPQQTLLISIAAGITTIQMQSWLLNQNHPIIRAMPNLPALLGYGITGLFATSQANTAHQQMAENIFQSVGQALWISQEDQMNVVTALSGSGPAYFFYFFEALISSAQALGLPLDIASKLTLNTALGSAYLALQADDNISTLRERVTSKGGTTEEGIQVLKDGKLEHLLAKAIIAATTRSKTLSEQYD